MTQKVIRYIILLLAVIFMASSCVLYEDVTFHADGKITYHLTVDMEKVMMLSSFKNQGDSTIYAPSSDTIISIGEHMKRKEAENKLTDEEKLLFGDMKQLSLRRIESQKDNILKIEIYGAFDNDEQLNKALIAMNNLMEYSENNEVKNNSQTSPEFVSQYSWDKFTMTRYTVKNPFYKEEAEDDSMLSTFGGMSSSLRKDSLKVKYHFPYRVEKINNAEATPSQDRKTVYSVYEVDAFSLSTKSANISITVVKP